MKYYFHKLKNGLRVGIASIPGDKTATALLSFRVSSKNDPDSKRGIAHFIEHMLFKGTKNRPKLTQVERAIERLGGIFNGFTVKEFTWFYIKLLRNDLEKALNILHDVALNSLFLPSELEKEKQVILEEINIYNDSPSGLLEDLFEQCLYDDQPIARLTLGDIKTIKKFKSDDLIDFFKKFYVVSNAAVTIAGGIDIQQSFKLAEKYFSDLSSGEDVKDIRVVEKQLSPKVIVKHKNISQTQIALGVRAFALNHEDHYPAKLIAILLGGNMSSRLFKRLREELGLVYDIYTMSESRQNAGYLATYTGAEKKNIAATVKEILKEYKRLEYQEVEKDELEDA